MKFFQSISKVHAKGLGHKMEGPMGELERALEKERERERERRLHATLMKSIRAKRGQKLNTDTL
jgi:hypothetical protein